MSKVMTKPRSLAVKPTPAARPTVDFPRQDEKIAAAEYTLRLSAPEGAETVEVSMDQESWQPCREALGYWWFDWSGYENGEHEVVARSRDGKGASVHSEPHEFFVELQPRASS